MVLPTAAPDPVHAGDDLAFEDGDVMGLAPASDGEAGLLALVRAPWLTRVHAVGPMPRRGYGRP